jgi:hypothetical protein
MQIVAIEGNGGDICPTQNVSCNELRLKFEILRHIYVLHFVSIFPLTVRATEPRCVHEPCTNVLFGTLLIRL